MGSSCNGWMGGAELVDCVDIVIFGIRKMYP